MPCQPRYTARATLTINSYQYGNAANGNSESGTIGYTINGYHPYIRLKFDSNVGNIVTILAR